MLVHLPALRDQLRAYIAAFEGDAPEKDKPQRTLPSPDALDAARTMFGSLDSTMQDAIVDLVNILMLECRTSISIRGISGSMNAETTTEKARQASRRTSAMHVVHAHELDGSADPMLAAAMHACLACRRGSFSKKNAKNRTKDNDEPIRDVKELGSGFFGTVFRVSMDDVNGHEEGKKKKPIRNTRGKGPNVAATEYAVKVERLKPWMLRDLPASIDMFKWSIANSRKAGDAGIGPRIYDAFVCKSNEARVVHFITVMELINGVTLNDWMESPSVLDVSEVARVRDKVGKLVKAMHSLNIMHNDIHGGNVMVENDGGVRIIDFGLSNTPKQNKMRDSMYEKNMMQLSGRLATLMLIADRAVIL
jgi:Protein kinase domain